ncbi:MAG: YraN family protein [Desulfotomaculum sp.]|nr:YraN family protein [Desulfotomaculum sp.]
MTMFRQKTGKLGEKAAVKILRQAGMRIKCCNYSCPIGEIDIIAEDNGVLVFVEVRSRRTGGFGSPQESVGNIKKKKIYKTALYYLASQKIKDKDCRFDVVAVLMNREGKVRKIEHIKNAF